MPSDIRKFADMAACPDAFLPDDWGDPNSILKVLLVAEITFVNVASSLTPLGSPQNILLWSASKATFLRFVAGTWLPVLLSGVIATVATLPLRTRGWG